MTDRGRYDVGFRLWVVGVLMLFVACTAGCNRGSNTDAQMILAGKAQLGDIVGMEQALNKGADVNTEWSLNTPLSWAIYGDQLAAVKFLVSRGAKVNAHFGLPKRTALQQAAEGGNLDIVIYLVEAGADINARNKFDRTAIYHARRGLSKDPKQLEDVIRFLASRGAVE